MPSFTRSNMVGGGTLGGNVSLISTRPSVASLTSFIHMGRSWVLTKCFGAQPSKRNVTSAAWAETPPKRVAANHMAANAISFLNMFLSLFLPLPAAEFPLEPGSLAMKRRDRKPHRQKCRMGGQATFVLMLIFWLCFFRSSPESRALKLGTTPLTMWRRFSWPSGSSDSMTRL